MNLKKKDRPAALPRKKRKYTKQNFLEFLCVVPALALILLTAYFPIADLFRISLTNWNMLKPTYEYVGLTNWKWLIAT